MTKQKSLNKYKKSVFGKISPGQDKVDKALERAHEIRKFEIGLYWQRSLFFWGFIVSYFTSYFILLGLSEDLSLTSEGESSASKEYLFVYVILLGLSFLGLFTSVAWFYIERGARSWQKNWEYHIDFLESAAKLNLYKTILGRPKKFYSPASIHKSIIFSVGFCWFILSGFSSYLVQVNEAIPPIAECPWFILWALTVGVFFAICCWLYNRLWRTSPETFGNEDPPINNLRLTKRRLPKPKFPS